MLDVICKLQSISLNRHLGMHWVAVEGLFRIELTFLGTLRNNPS